MTKTQKQRLALGCLSLLLTGLVTGTGGARGAGAAVSAYSQQPRALPQKAQDLIREAQSTSDAYVDLDLTVSAENDSSVMKAIADAGGQVVAQEQTYIRARVPAAAAAELPKTMGVVGVGVNQPLSIDQAQVAPADKELTSADAKTLAAMNYSPVGIDQFRKEHDVQGRGIIVAVIDSGVDPGHPDLQKTPDGKPKLVDWKDFTHEGLVVTGQPVNLSGGTFTASDGRAFQLPAGLPAGSVGRFGYLDEQYVTGYINQDLDRNGLKIDRFGVLAVDVNQTGQYDTVYIDTNSDGDFRDEQPLTVFRNGHAYTSLGQYREGIYSTRRLNLVVSDIDPAGRFVQLGFDGLGHGTWVSGVLGAYNPDGFNGVAPGVQIMALKALRSTSAGDWFNIKDAIQYAATHGASIINLSVGDLATGAAKRFDTGASEWLNEIANKYGVLIVLAAGNSGPGLSSGATLGSPSSVLATGAYFSPEMWTRDYGWTVPHESVWFFSGMGPRSDGTYLPSVIAPGGSPTTSPKWRDSSGYSTQVGTSIATPHASGAAALLMEAGRKQGVRSDWLSVKRALEMGARHIPGFEVYEQGNGLIQLEQAMGHLQQIDSRPVLKATAVDGGEGILGRSYAPGGSAFFLTNQDTDLARVGIVSSDTWVRPSLTSMLLPPNVKRELALQVDPPADPGVHSAFLTVTQQAKYGPSLLLPVTYVRPIDLADLNYEYFAQENVEAGRYRRYFVNVPDGSAGLSVNVSIPSGQSGGGGTVQVHVFRPDGQVLLNDRIGLSGKGLVSLFQADDPMPGVWEVVVVAVPDRNSDGTPLSFSLNVREQPGALGTQPIQLSVAPGSTTTVPLKAINPLGKDFTGRLDASGLVRDDVPDPWYRSVPWAVQPKLVSVVETFTVKEWTRDARIEINNPVRSDINVPDTSDTDLTLSLYQVNQSGDWGLYYQSNTVGSNHETMVLSGLQPGTYSVLVTSNNDTPLNFQYRRLMGVDEHNLEVKDDVRLHRAGDVWNGTLTINAPTTPGRYTGYVQLRDTNSQAVVGWYPIEVSVGQQQLSVQPMVAQLTRGQPGSVVLQVRNANTQKLVSNVTISVNGQAYWCENGRVSVPVVPGGDNQVLDVSADVPGYQFFRLHLTFPVKSAWAPYPLGIEQNQENSIWRRKVTSQLP